MICFRFIDPAAYRLRRHRAVRVRTLFPHADAAGATRVGEGQQGVDEDMVAGGSGGGGAISHRAPLEWKFSQVFGERAPGEQINDVDTISTIEFEKKGDHLAVGDHGGRVVLFERADGKAQSPYSREELEHLDFTPAVHPRYVYKTEFQSHEPEFDYLKSLEIEEKVNKLRWCATIHNSLFILSTNNKTIKLWKILGPKVQKVKEVSPNQHVHSENALLSEHSFTAGQNGKSLSGNGQLEWIHEKPKDTSTYSQEEHSMIPSIQEATSRCRRVYAHAHEYNINSISINSDCETFISADDLRINLWNLEISNQCFNVVDMKPPNMEDLIEVITAAEFHPTHCNLLACSSSRGFIRLFDMRQSALCDQKARIIQDSEAQASKSIFSEIIASISDIKFAVDGMHILSRDYMHLKLWDLRMETSPVATFRVHEYIRPKLSELYNNDSIFDKFECSVSGDGFHFASGSYSNNFRVFSCDDGIDDGTTLEASKNPYRASIYQPAPKATKLLSSFARGHNKRGHENFSLDGSNGISNDLKSKITHLAWHPTSNLIACATGNSLHMYYA